MRHIRTIVAIASAMLIQARGAAPDAVVTEAIINAPADAVWQAFTTKEGVESWMVAKTDIDLRVGGLWRTSYSKDSSLDDDASIHHMVLAYDPGHMLAFRTIKPPKGFPFPNEIVKTWTVVYFEPVDAAHTKVTARMMGFTAGEDSQKMRDFFESGNRQEMDALVKRFEAKW